MARDDRSGSRLVYSTETGPGDRRTGSGPTKKGKKGRRGGAPSSAPRVPDDGVVRVWRQTKGRRGKGVTVITGLALPPVDLAKLAKQLKAACGAGGTVKDGVVEIQGDHRETVVDHLRTLGHTVKKAGG
ncbi:MAG: stress response translation initiation inhibitor YciH [Acidobacteriota bacterium]